MPRSEHFLFQARPSPWPKAVVAASVRVKWEPDAEYATRERCTLAAWHVAVATKGSLGYTVSRIAAGATYAAFWDGMRECLSRAGGVTVICANTRQAAVALNLWEMLENGEITIAGKDHTTTEQTRGDVQHMQGRGRDNVVGIAEQVPTERLPELRNDMDKAKRNGRRNRRSTAARRGGIMILQDPPIVMELQLAGCPFKLVWLDVANYGLGAADLFGDDDDTAIRIGKWFCGAAATLKQLGDCGWQNTAGSQAMHLFRSSYLETPILSQTHPVACSLERAALFGGRCECFKIGKVAGPVHLLDIRSMYPYLCSVLPLPVRLVRVVERPGPDTLRNLPDRSFCIAEVAIQTDHPDYPVNHNDSISYPIGRYWATIAGAELAHALQAGVVRGVRYAAYYETEFVLRRYAEELYAHRVQADKDGDKAKSAYMKRLMVAVVGKFAQQERHWADSPHSQSAFEWGEWYQTNSDGNSERWRSIANYVQREVIGGWSHGAVPAITVCITSGGRARLREVMDAADRANVFYCDTDAVITNDYGLERLTIAGWVRQGEWGYLQHVESADECTIYGDKHYTIGGRIRQSGKQIARGGIGDSGTGEQSQPWIGWSMRHQQRPADWREPHPYQRGEGRYDRIRCAGGVVRPVELWEW